MLKSRLSLRSYGVALLALSGATLFGAGRSFAAPASGKTPAKVNKPINEPKRATPNYPRRADGFWDWKNSPDIKSGVVDPKLVEFYSLKEKMRAELLDIFRGHAELEDSDMFIVDNKAARSSNKILFNTEYAIDYAVTWSMNQKYTPDLISIDKGSMTYTIANLAAKGLLDKRARDANMKLLLASTLENQVRALTFTPDPKGASCYTLSHKTEKNVWNELLSEVSIYQGKYWKDESYNGAKKIQMAKSTVHNLKEFPNVTSYIDWLKAYKNPITDLKAQMFSIASTFQKSAQAVSPLK